MCKKQDMVVVVVGFLSAQRKPAISRKRMVTGTGIMNPLRPSVDGVVIQQHRQDCGSERSFLPEHP